MYIQSIRVVTRKFISNSRISALLSFWSMYPCIIRLHTIRKPMSVISFRACTSIIAVDNEGNLIHGRNLDYAAPDDLRKITIQVDFLRHGQVK